MQIKELEISAGLVNQDLPKLSQRLQFPDSFKKVTDTEYVAITDMDKINIRMYVLIRMEEK